MPTYYKHSAALFDINRDFNEFLIHAEGLYVDSALPANKFINALDGCIANLRTLRAQIELDCSSEEQPQLTGIEEAVQQCELKFRAQSPYGWDGKLRDSNTVTYSHNGNN